jgi:hypothetical protein
MTSGVNMATRSHEDWVTLLQEQPASGLTITAFCRLHKVSISSFYARKADMAKTSSPKLIGDCHGSVELSAYRFNLFECFTYIVTHHQRRWA